MNLLRGHFFPSGFFFFGCFRLFSVVFGRAALPFLVPLRGVETRRRIPTLKPRINGRASLHAAGREQAEKGKRKSRRRARANDGGRALKRRVPNVVGSAIEAEEDLARGLARLQLRSLQVQRIEKLRARLTVVLQRAFESVKARKEREKKKKKNTTSRRLFRRPLKTRRRYLKKKILTKMQPAPGAEKGSDSSDCSSALQAAMFSDDSATARAPAPAPPPAFARQLSSPLPRAAGGDDGKSSSAAAAKAAALGRLTSSLGDLASLAAGADGSCSRHARSDPSHGGGGGSRGAGGEGPGRDGDEGGAGGGGGGALLSPAADARVGHILQLACAIFRCSDAAVLLGDGSLVTAKAAPPSKLARTAAAAAAATAAAAAAALPADASSTSPGSASDASPSGAAAAAPAVSLLAWLSSRAAAPFIPETPRALFFYVFFFPTHQTKPLPIHPSLLDPNPYLLFPLLTFLLFPQYNQKDKFDGRNPLSSLSNPFAPPSSLFCLRPFSSFLLS